MQIPVCGQACAAGAGEFCFDKIVVVRPLLKVFKAEKNPLTQKILNLWSLSVARQLKT